MRSLFAIIVLCLGLVGTCLSQSSESAAAELTKLPSCALSCLEIAIGASTCPATNTTCVCLDQQLLANATACVSLTCTIIESLTALNVTKTLCGVKVNDKSSSYSVLILTFFILGIIVVGVRMISKPLAHSDFGLDDASTALLFVSGIASLVLSFRGTISNGLGKDIWTLTPDNITAFLKAFFFMEILYFAQVALMKITLLMFYLRIFPGIGIRRLIWATVAFNVAFGTTFVFAAIFSCTPVNYFWHVWDGEHTGTCININVLGWANAGVSIAVDIWMLALPMSQLAGLRLHWKKKAGVAMMFGVGTFVTVISILRLQSLVEFVGTSNPTMDNLAVSQWSFLEVTIGMMCSCMPSIRLLLVRFFPRVFSSRSQSTSNGGRYYTNGSRSRGFNSISVAGGPDKKGNVLTSANEISRKTTYTVEFANATKIVDSSSDNDEIQLVPMNMSSPRVLDFRHLSEGPVKLSSPQMLNFRNHIEGPPRL